MTTDIVTNINAVDTREEAEAKRLTFKNPEKFGLLCLWQSETKQLWTVVTLPVLDAFMEGA